MIINGHASIGVIDTKNRTYLTSKVNSLFLARSEFQWVSEGSNKKLPTKNGEESSLVAEAVNDTKNHLLLSF
jgi:hypothetical protein